MDGQLEQFNSEGSVFMATIFDVADWFLSKEAMTPKKLQKLCYFYKAWGLALYDEDFLPKSRFEAWVHGPVNPELHQKYMDYYWNDIPKKDDDNSAKFSENKLDVLGSVWLSYGDMTDNAIAAETKVGPWRDARVGVKDGEVCTNQLNNEDIKRYYKRLHEAHQGE